MRQLRNLNEALATFSHLLNLLFWEFKSSGIPCGKFPGQVLFGKRFMYGRRAEKYKMKHYLGLWDKAVVKLFTMVLQSRLWCTLGYSLQDWKCYLLRGLGWIPAEVILRQRELPAPHSPPSPGMECFQWLFDSREYCLILPSSPQLQYRISLKTCPLGWVRILILLHCRSIILLLPNPVSFDLWKGIVP